MRLTTLVLASANEQSANKERPAESREGSLFESAYPWTPLDFIQATVLEWEMLNRTAEFNPTRPDLEYDFDQNVNW